MVVKIETRGQVSMIGHYRAEDRNFAQGGRSFYFFDLDDNVFHLDSKILIFNKHSGAEFALSTAEFAKAAHQIGIEGTEWQDFRVDDDPQHGSFRNFRDQPDLDVDDQAFIKDFRQALESPFVDWRGPSWDFFIHAVNNNRPIALITARGHHPYTIQRAFNILVSSKILDVCPNYLAVYPLSHPEVRSRLGDPQFKLSTAQAKKKAIQSAVQDAFACYGSNPAHRFGMSDDDPQNVALITEAMIELKEQHPENAFFVINTYERQLEKQEIDSNSVVKVSGFKHREFEELVQMQLF